MIPSILRTISVFRLSKRVSSFSERMAEAVKEKINLIEEKKLDVQTKSKKNKYNGKHKRLWENLSNRRDGEEKRVRVEGEEFERIKKKKSLLLLAYSGVNYFGMQRNPEMKTIEEELLKAMLNAKWITQDGYELPQQMQFQRAARTDKGVSAMHQIVSLKLPEVLDIDALNNELPEQIKVFSIKRVTKGFNSKSSCDARTYSYTLPTFSFADHKEEVDESTYRLPEDRLKRIQATLKMYEGTKNFHNFTSRKDFHDASAKRFIMSFECEQPFVPEGCTIEFVRLKVQGQSFMLHQIRKMVGLLLAIFKGHTPIDTYRQAITKDRIDIPMAPGLGLVLNKIHYDNYNERFGNDGIHEPLDFTDQEEEIEKFFKKHILSTIIKTEMEEKSMSNWLQTLNLHSYAIRAEEPVKNVKRSKDDDDDE